ncbi:hypothetical protein GYH30_019104 [Glycine max]|nr:hypothetical protein GYH30_019104 [Glycine max]
MQHAASNDGLRRVVNTGVQILKNLPPSLEKGNGLHNHRPSLHEHSIEQVLRRSPHSTRRERGKQKRQEREAPVTNDVRANVVAADADDLVPHHIAGGEAVVEEAIAEVGSVVGAAGGLDANIPENLLVVRHDLEEQGREAVAAAVNVRVRVNAEVDGGGVDGAAHVGERGEFLEGLGGFEEAAAADGDLDELRVELGGEEAGDHVGDLGDEVGVEGVAGGEGFGGEAVGEAGEDHGDGVVGGEGEVGEGDVGLELVDDSGEDGVGEAVEGAPVGVAERGFQGPDVFCGEGAEGRDRVVRGRRGARGGDEGEDGGDGEEEERGDGGGVEEGGCAVGVGEEGAGGVQGVVELEEIRDHYKERLIHSPLKFEHRFFSYVRTEEFQIFTFHL